MVTEYSLVVRRYAPFESFGGGFEGDNRLYSTSLTAKARTSGEVTFGPAGSIPAAIGKTSGSAWVGPWAIRKSGKWLRVGTYQGYVSVKVSNQSTTDGKIKFTVHTEGNMPLKDILLPTSVAGVINNATDKFGLRRKQLSPDIDTFVDFEASFLRDRVIFTGAVRGDGFPNAEIFVIDHFGRAVGLLDYRTKSGAAGPLYRLFLDGHRTQIAAFARTVPLSAGAGFAADSMTPPPITLER